MSAIANTGAPGLPEKGKEYPVPDEEQYTLKIVNRFKRVLTKAYTPGQTMRMFHPKMHGLVRATFMVNSDLEEQYRIGIFRTAKTYPAWIRLSNAKRKPSPDKKKDMRGFAIKLMGVEGQQLLKQNQNAGTQDFLMVTSPILQTKSVKDFQVAIFALTGGIIALFLYAITHVGTILRSIKMVGSCKNLLDQQYFSTVPSRFGTEALAVKYSVRPQKPINTSAPDKANVNYLREQLRKDLANGPVTYDFMVQFQEDPIKQPIEDPRIEWTTPFIKLATINILQQEFDNEAQNFYGENLSMSPWHGIEPHRPLGGVNRARKQV